MDIKKLSFISRFQFLKYILPARFMAFVYIVRLKPKIEISLYSGKSKIIGIQMRAPESVFPEKAQRTQRKEIAEPFAPVLRDNPHHVNVPHLRLTRRLSP